MKLPLFSPGRTVATSALFACMEDCPSLRQFVQQSFNRHLSADWGDITQSDKDQNRMALIEGKARLFSVYSLPEPLMAQAA